MWETLQSSLVYLLVLALGYGAKRTGLFKKESAGFLSVLIMDITLPCAILNTIGGSPFHWSLLLITACAVVLNCLLLAAAVLTSAKQPAGERILSILNSNTFNNGNFAIPFLSGMVSAEGFSAMCMYDMGSAIMTFGPNLALVQKVLARPGSSTGPVQVAKRLLTTPTFVAYLVMLGMNALGWNLPPLVDGVVSMGAAANPFLAMLCVGILFELRLPRSGGRLIARCLALRYGICTLFALGLWLFLPADPQVVRTLVVMTFAPIASCAVMLTVDSGGDGSMAAVLNSLSMVISIAVMLVLLVLLPLPVR